MHIGVKSGYAEWGFVSLLAGLCAVLTVLQYRWTGDVSRAEAEYLRAGIKVRAQQFGLAFDSALTGSCAALVPSDADLSNSNRFEVHAQRFQEWKSGHPRPIFSRVTVMVTTLGGTWLFDQDLATGKLAPAAVPFEVLPFSQFFSRPSGNAPSPIDGFSGMRFLVFVSPLANNRTPAYGSIRPFEIETMLFELDAHYLRNTWLPELCATHLNTPGQQICDVVVKTVSPPEAVIFASPATNAVHHPEPPITLMFNRQGRDPGISLGPGTDFSWKLEVRPRPGAIEAIVASSHRRNLTVAIVMNGLIFAAGLALVQHTRRSRQLAEAQLSFVATVSHELRTPLTVIRGAGHNLLRGVAREPAQIEQYSKLIIQHAEQLTEMVEQILGLAGIRKNSAALIREPVAIPELLREAVAATEQEARAARCEVCLDLPPDLPAAHGDAPALRRVFQNLITNAAKHGGQGGWIGIAATRVALNGALLVEIKVADRGPGIPRAELPRIFEPFFRGAAAQTMQTRGGGLGLSLVKEIVEAHGGTVTVEDNPGGGAVFIVRLPTAGGTT